MTFGVTVPIRSRTVRSRHLDVAHTLGTRRRRSLTRANGAISGVGPPQLSGAVPEHSEEPQRSFTRASESPTQLPQTSRIDVLGDLLELLAEIAVEATADEEPLHLVGTIQLGGPHDAGSGRSRVA
jgi:hypothetical protein